MLFVAPLLWKNLCLVYVFPTKLSVHMKYKDVLWIALEKVFPDSGTKINLFALEGLLAVLKGFFFVKPFQGSPASAK